MSGPTTAEPAPQGLSVEALTRSAARNAEPSRARPSAEALREALKEVAARGKLGDAAAFGRDLRISLEPPPRSGATIGRRRSRMIERSVLGAFAGFCLAAAATMGLGPASSPRQTPPSLAETTLQDRGLYATGSLPGSAAGFAPDRLSQAEMAALLGERPIRCAASAPTLLGLRLAARPVSAPEGACAEAVRYDLARGVFVQRTAVSNGAYAEINGAFSLEDGVLCHLTAGATAHALGSGRDLGQARQAAERFNRGLDELAGAPVCHAFKPADGAAGRFVAEIATAGPVESDATAPFQMRAE